MAKPASIDGDYVTNCPHCGCGRLLVVEVTLSDGRTYSPGTRLTADGFVVDPDDTLDLEDQSTEDEVVLCPECRKFMPLAELML